MVAVAAITFCVLITIVIAFQLALAGGAPWGRYAMGGKFPGTLPARLRVAAVVQAGLLGLLAIVVLARAGLVPPELVSARRFIWVVVGVSAVALVLNVITPSAAERRLWAPVTVLMLASSLAVAVGT